MTSEIEISEQTLRDVLKIKEISEISTQTLREILKTVERSKKSLVERITEYSWFKRWAKKRTEKWVNNLDILIVRKSGINFRVHLAYK
jgi:hypothetical protein